MLFFSCFFWALIFGLRAYTVGNDTYGYSGFYDGTDTKSGGYGTVTNPGNTIEWGFIFIGRILWLFTRNATVCFLLHGCFVLYMIYWWYKDQQTSIMSFLWLMMFGSMISTLMVAERQSWAIGFQLLSCYFFSKVNNFNIREYYKYVKNKKVILGLCSLIFSISIHRSSIIYVVVLPIIYLIKFRKSTAYSLLFFSFTIATFFPGYLSNIYDIIILAIGSSDDSNISLLADRYDVDSLNAGASIIRLLSLCLPAVVTIYFAEIKEVESFRFKMLIIGLSLYMILSGSTIVSRMIALFIVVGYSAIIPNAITMSKKLHYFYILCTIYWLWRNYEGFYQIYMNPYDCMVPYEFIFE